MIEREVQIKNPSGLHARAAARLVHLTGSFSCDVFLVRDGQATDAKSILGILLLAAAQGAELVVRCDGSDEQEAVAAIAALFERGFEELPTGSTSGDADGEGIAP